MTTNLAFEAIARREAHELQLQQKNKNNKRFLEKTRAEDFASTPSKKGVLS